MASSIRRSVAIAAATLFITAAARSDTPASDVRAITIADDVMRALGGEQAWKAVRGVRWIFGAEAKGRPRGNPRRHSWDRWTGWHRVQGLQRDGRAYLIVHNLNDGRGKAWVAGTPIEGDSLKKLIAFGKSLWTNDSYWLLMPYKLQDPGVTLKYDGDTTVAGVAYDRLAMSFDHVGETPGDHYWIYVNRVKHQIQAWEMILEGDTPPRKHFTWEGWTVVGHLMFPTAHRDTMFAETPPGDTLRTNVYTRDVQTVDSFPAGEFPGF